MVDIQKCIQLHLLGKPIFSRVAIRKPQETYIWLAEFAKTYQCSFILFWKEGKMSRGPSHCYVAWFVGLIWVAELVQSLQIWHGTLYLTSFYVHFDLYWYGIWSTSSDLRSPHILPILCSMEISFVFAMGMLLAWAGWKWKYGMTGVWVMPHGFGRLSGSILSVGQILWFCVRRTNSNGKDRFDSHNHTLNKLASAFLLDC